MKKRTLISTTAGLAVTAMLMGAGFVATANAAEVNSNDITITQPAAVPGQLIEPTMNGRKFKDGAVRNLVVKATTADGTETTLTKDEQYTVDVTNGTSDVENTKNINDFAKTGGVIMTMLALAGALALWMAVFCFFSMS